MKTPHSELFIEKDPQNLDGLNFLAEQNMSYVNRKAMEGTILAHTDGGVPNIVLEVDSLKEFDLGYLIYFFERACAISGYLLGVNPFDQPGVEKTRRIMDLHCLANPATKPRRQSWKKKLRQNHRKIKQTVENKGGYSL